MKIVEARGCIVRGEVLRAGRRFCRSDNAAILRNSRLSKRDRKSAIVHTPLHEDAWEGYNNILAFGLAAYKWKILRMQQ